MQRGDRMGEIIMKIGMGLLLTGFTVAMLGLVALITGYMIVEAF